MNTQSSIERIAAALGIDSKEFHNSLTMTAQEKRSAVLEQTYSLLANVTGVTTEEFKKEWQLSLLRRERPIRGPAIHDQTYSLEDGKGRVINVGNFGATLYFEEKSLTKCIAVVDLSWNEQFNRWEYGDLDRK